MVDPKILRPSEEGKITELRTLLMAGGDVNAIDDNGSTYLINASIQGDTNIVKFLLKHNPDINQRDKEGTTALIWASSQGHKDIVQLLCTAGANVNFFKCDKHGQSALMEASKEGHLECVEILLDNRADINALSSDHLSALWFSCVNGHSEITRLLCTRGADVHIKNMKETIPLSAAAHQEHSKCVEILLDFGSSIDWKNKESITAAYIASQQGQTEALSVLCAHGADVNTISEMQCSALIMAAWHGHTSCVKMLLDHKASVNYQNSHGTTALAWASEYGFLDIVKMLVEKGADLTLSDNDGDNALLAAAFGNKTECVEYLLEQGSDASSQNKKMETVLLKAASKGNIEMTRLLIEYAPETVNTCDISGDSPLIGAVKQSSLPCIEALLAHDADVNLMNASNLTALSWALLTGNTDIIEKLKESGADPTLLNQTWQGTNLQTFSKHKAMIHACKDGSSEILQFLCQQGVSINNCDEDGDTPLCLASRNNHISCVKILLQNKADINQQALHNYTALHCAVEKKFFDIFKLLVQHGADLDLCTVEGWTAVRLALLPLPSGLLDCRYAEFLLECGADFTIKDCTGISALDSIKVNPTAKELLHFSNIDIESYLKLISPSWKKLNIPTLIFVFRNEEDLEAAYYRLNFGSCKTQWKCTEKHSNMSSFSVNKENDTMLITFPYANHSGKNFILMDMYQAKTGQNQNIPAIYSKIEEARLMHLNRMSVTAPCVSPCLQEARDKMHLEPGCLIKCSELKLEGGKYALANCPIHHKIITGDKIAKWFTKLPLIEPEPLTAEVLSQLGRSIGAKYHAIAIEFLGYTDEEIEELEESYPRNIDRVKYKILNGWVMKNPRNPRYVSIHFSLLMNTNENLKTDLQKNLSDFFSCFGSMPI